jgi:hypothetical protein
MSNLDLRTHQSYTERIHDNLQSVIGNSISGGFSQLCPVVIGDGASVSTMYASAIGCNATATGSQAMAIGSGVIGGAEPPITATGDRSLAIGADGTSATATEAFAAGSGASASGDGSLALGLNSVASADNAVAIGGGNASGNGSIAIRGTASGANSITIGSGSTNGGSISIGDTIIGANATDNVVIGNNHTLTTGNDRAVLIGEGCSAVTSAIAIGDSATANFNSAIAMGNGATVTSNNGIAIGPSSTAANGSVHIGSGLGATGSSAISIGSGSSAAGATSIAIGSNSNATITDAIGIGRMCVANARGVVLGATANLQGVTDGLALGFGAGAAPGTLTAARSVAIICNGASIVGAPGAATAGLQVSINGLPFIIPLV